MGSQRFSIRQLTPAIGAEVRDIDLAKPLSPDLQDNIYDALIKYQVIFFRDQNITPEDHLSLARSFGEPQLPHPIYPYLKNYENILVLENGPENPPDTDGWHTDVTFSQNPPFASILLAREVPDCGGDTLWASLCRAYETLPEGIKSELEDMKAVHDMGDFRNNYAIGECDGTKIQAAHQKFGSAIHSVVKTHPISGRKFVYINEGFTQHLVGMRATDSNKLLEFLYHHIAQPENQVRFHWTPGAIAIWGNRCTWHYATADYLPDYRLMHRITVINDRRVDTLLRNN